MALRALHDVPAPAKLNLFLHVVGRRGDGYHLLQSAFVMIDWADRLSFELRNDGQLSRHDLNTSLPADDLCLRAARTLQHASGTALGAAITIDKQLPWGAGLGGGSSDAATVLLALNRLWQLNWSRAQLATLALPLGADVPFFVGGRNAFVEGIGERLTSLDLPPACYAVVKPAQSIATRSIFEHPRLVRDTAPVILLGSSEEAGRSGLPAVDVADIVSGFGRNDLQPAAESSCAEVATAARWLDRHCGNSRMTGSGSALFARAGTAESPLAPCAPFPSADLPAGWVGRMCRSLDLHPLFGWAD